MLFRKVPAGMVNAPPVCLSHLTPAMKPQIPLKPLEKEILRLHASGKSPDVIAIRLGMKMSKVISVLAVMPKP